MTKRKLPKFNSKYYYIDVCSGHLVAYRSYWLLTIKDFQRFMCGNYFRIKKDATKEISKIKKAYTLSGMK